jgi:hypothetical protein
LVILLLLGDSLEKLLAGSEFCAGWIAAECAAKDFLDAVVGGVCRESSNFAGLIENERVVEVEQGLLGDGGLVASWCVGIRAGQIEGSKNAGQVLSIDACIDGAAFDGGVICEVS